MSERRGGIGPRQALLFVFAVHALLFSSWTAQIPKVKAELGLSEADLGTALLGAPIGSVLAILAARWLLPRLGSRRVLGLALVGCCVTGAGVGMATSWAGLLLALSLWGIAQGALGVSMNTQAVAVERAVGRPIMSSFHASWSVGAFVGAGLGAAAVAAGMSVTVQLAVTGCLLIGVGYRAPSRLLPDGPVAELVQAEPEPAEPGRTEPNRVEDASGGRGVLVLGAVAIATMLCEGAAADWSALYLRETVQLSPALSGLGYAGYAAAAVVFRLCGDKLLTRFPVRAVLPLLAGVATVVFAVSLVLRSPAAALLGFSALGVGLALVIPAVFTAAGRLPAVHTGAAVATVAALGWVGYVGGPPLIGYLASRTSLSVALGVLPLLTATIAVVMRVTKVFESQRSPVR